MMTMLDLISVSYVEMLENQQAQLVAGLQELYRRVQTGEGWTGAPLKESNKGAPLTHEILERLGALKHDNHYSDEIFEENLDVLQHKLLANGSGFMQRGMSFDTSSEAGHSPVFEPVTHHKASHFTNPWAVSHLPPTPPTNSPRPSLVKTSSPLKSQIATPVSQLSEQSPIFTEPSELNDGMDFSMSYQPSDFDIQQDMQAYYDPIHVAINPSLTMKNGWLPHEDYSQQFYLGGSFT